MDPLKLESLDYYKKAAHYEGDGQIGLALTYYRKAYKLNPELDQDLHLLTLDDEREATMPEPQVTQSDRTSCESTVPRTKRSHDNLSSLPAELVLRIFEASLLSSSLVSLITLSMLNSYYHDLSHDACLWKTIYMTLSRPIHRSDHFRVEQEGSVLQDALYAFYEKERQTRARTYFSSNMRLLTDSSSPSDAESSFNYYRMVQWLPRVRSQGLYICRIVYTRPGQTEGAFNQPIHIVTYYRYLYFHQKTRHVSLLLSNDDPATIVPSFVSYLLQQQESVSSRTFMPSSDRTRPLDRHPSQALGQLTTGYYLQEGPELFIIVAPSLRPLVSAPKTGHSKRQLSLFTIRLGILNHSLATKHLYHDGAKLQWISFAEKNMETNESATFDVSIFKSFIYSPVKALNDV